MKHNLATILLYILAIAAITIVFVVVVAHYMMTTTTHDPSAHTRLELIRQLEPGDIHAIQILVPLREPQFSQPMEVMLQCSQDHQDIMKLLDALKQIQLSDRPVRVPIHRVRIRIIGKVGKPTVELCGNFDPRRAPILSPRMRSPDVSNIIQEIVIHKGKEYHIKTWHQNK